ncbi:MAG: phosphoglucosamine mutase [Lachnospiraceae bacterium]|nr:phosphoglucosamine mutase [Lachnospiraceae bacterium]
MGRMFGTDGVRGIANKELTVDLAMKLGMAGAYVLSKNADHRPRILVGCDTRISGDMLANALMAGICSVGADAEYLGILPTPAVAYLTRTGTADAGVVISASHNPVEFNGIKFFDGNGFKLPDSVEDKIENIVSSNCEGLDFKTGTEVGRIAYNLDAYKEYVKYAVNTSGLDLKGMKVVIDCAEGASYKTSVETLTELSADLVAIHNNPDGTNINAGCGSTHLEDLMSTVKTEGADVGLAFDGDADRLLAVDENGDAVNGDEIMAIIGCYMKEKGVLKKDTIVATVMSNLGLFIMGDEKGINIEKTKVGDRYVLERMKEMGANLGGEQSGHIIFLDENTTGDGLLSALHLLKVIKESGKKLSELRKVMEVLPQALVNAKVPVDKKNSYMEYKEVADAIKKVEAECNGAGRVLIRPSGTEPLVRVMIEGKDQKLIDQRAKELAALIEKVIR